MTGIATALARLSGPGLHEDSVKITANGLDWDRRLHSYPRRALLPGPVARFTVIAADLDLDAGPLLPHLKAASDVHLGVEGKAHKLYLEFPDGDLVFLAVKRDSAVNRYTRVTAPQGAIAQACAKLGGTVLEVTEDNSPRLSYDVNLSDAGLTVAALPMRLKLLADFNLPAEALDRIADAPLGHFASGVGRDGTPFATIYYGARHDP